MKSKIYESFSQEDTFALGTALAEKSRPGDIIVLNGDLGVGKTVFVKGFGKGLSIEEPISSPTFAILKIYESGSLPLYHFDVYRIAELEEMEEIGYEDYFYGKGVTVIEWAALIEEILPEERTIVTIEKDLEKGMNYRKIVVEWSET